MMPDLSDGMSSVKGMLRKKGLLYKLECRRPPSDGLADMTSAVRGLALGLKPEFPAKALGGGIPDVIPWLLEPFMLIIGMPDVIPATLEVPTGKPEMM